MAALFQGMLENIDKWLSASTSNYYSFLLVSGLVIVASFVVVWYFGRKIGKADERTNSIYAKISMDMLFALVILSMIFIANITKNLDHIQQLYMPFLALTCAVGAVSSVVRYNHAK